MTSDKGQVTHDDLPLTPLRLIGMFWSSPNSLLGLCIGLFGLCTGGRARRFGPTLEFDGGAIRWLLRKTPIQAGAMTLGHVIIGQQSEVLDRVRLHEWVHVRQYERWGPLFIPAYLLCSLWMRLSGKHFYRDNPFEVEAFESDRLRAAMNAHREIDTAAS